MKAFILCSHVFTAIASALPRLEPLSPLVEGLEPATNATAALTKRTGQGGNINLINGGPYTWNVTYSHTYQMNSWNFPSVIAPYSTSRIYIEFDTSIGKTESDDGGEVTYTLAGTSLSFQIQARSPGGRFTLQSQLLTMSTQGNPQGSTIPLGWVHDGQVNWILSGLSTFFVSNRPPPNWQQVNLPLIGKLPLQRLSMPGSHDAGMSRITGGTAFGFACNSLTQTVSIEQQLVAGSRYFDIRPVISSGRYYTGHYTGDADVLNTFQGANGQPISEIILQVNSFTIRFNELVIINLSHSLNTDVGSSDYRTFTQQEWDALLSQLMGLENLLVYNRLPGGFDPSHGDLTMLSLNQLISGRPAVVLVVQDSTDLSTWFGRGVFSYSQFNVTNSYTGTDSLSAMANDQLDKLVNEHNKMFLLSWTLTQTDTEAALCTKSILDLANTANPALYNTLINSVSPTRNIVPNILYIDNMTSPDIVGVAMAYNTWQSQR